MFIFLDYNLQGNHPSLLWALPSYFFTIKSSQVFNDIKNIKCEIDKFSSSLASSIFYTNNELMVFLVPAALIQYITWLPLQQWSWLDQPFYWKGQGLWNGYLHVPLFFRPSSSFSALECRPFAWTSLFFMSFTPRLLWPSTLQEILRCVSITILRSI